MALPVPIPPNGSARSLTIPKPSASRTITATTSSTIPRMRGTIPALAGGATRPISRSRSSCREEGASWPSFSMAALRSSGRRSASARDAFIIWRSAGRSCGWQPASASLK